MDIIFDLGNPSNLLGSHEYTINGNILTLTLANNAAVMVQGTPSSNITEYRIFVESNPTPSSRTTTTLYFNTTLDDSAIRKVIISTKANINDKNAIGKELCVFGSLNIGLGTCLFDLGGNAFTSKNHPSQLCEIKLGKTNGVFNFEIHGPTGQDTIKFAGIGDFSINNSDTTIDVYSSPDTASIDQFTNAVIDHISGTINVHIGYNMLSVTSVSAGFYANVHSEVACNFIFDADVSLEFIPSENTDKVIINSYNVQFMPHEYINSFSLYIGSDKHLTFIGCTFTPTNSEQPILELYDYHVPGEESYAAGWVKFAPYEDDDHNIYDTIITLSGREQPIVSKHDDSTVSTASTGKVYVPASYKFQDNDVYGVQAFTYYIDSNPLIVEGATDPYDFGTFEMPFNVVCSGEDLQILLTITAHSGIIATINNNVNLAFTSCNIYNYFGGDNAIYQTEGTAVDLDTGDRGSFSFTNCHIYATREHKFITGHTRTTTAGHDSNLFLHPYFPDGYDSIGQWNFVTGEGQYTIDELTYISNISTKDQDDTYDFDNMGIILGNGGSKTYKIIIDLDTEIFLKADNTYTTNNSIDAYCRGLLTLDSSFGSEQATLLYGVFESHNNTDFSSPLKIIDGANITAFGSDGKHGTIITNVHDFIDYSVEAPTKYKYYSYFHGCIFLMDKASDAEGYPVPYRGSFSNSAVPAIYPTPNKTFKLSGDDSASWYSGVIYLPIESTNQGDAIHITNIDRSDLTISTFYSSIANLTPYLKLNEVSMPITIYVNGREDTNTTLHLYDSLFNNENDTSKFLINLKAKSGDAPERAGILQLEDGNVFNVYGKGILSNDNGVYIEISDELDIEINYYSKTSYNFGEGYRKLEYKFPINMYPYELIVDGEPTIYPDFVFTNVIVFQDSENYVPNFKSVVGDQMPVINNSHFYYPIKLTAIDTTTITVKNTIFTYTSDSHDYIVDIGGDGGVVNFTEDVLIENGEEMYNRDCLIRVSESSDLMIYDDAFNVDFITQPYKYTIHVTSSSGSIQVNTGNNALGNPANIPVLWDYLYDYSASQQPYISTYEDPYIAYNYDYSIIDEIICYHGEGTHTYMINDSIITYRNLAISSGKPLTDVSTVQNEISCISYNLTGEDVYTDSNELSSIFNSDVGENGYFGQIKIGDSTYGFSTTHTNGIDSTSKIYKVTLQFNTLNTDVYIGNANMSFALNPESGEGLISYGIVQPYNYSLRSNTETVPEFHINNDELTLGNSGAYKIRYDPDLTITCAFAVNMYIFPNEVDSGIISMRYLKRGGTYTEDSHYNAYDDYINASNNYLRYFEAATITTDTEDDLVLNYSFTGNAISNNITTLGFGIFPVTDRNSHDPTKSTIESITINSTIEQAFPLVSLDPDVIEARDGTNTSSVLLYSSNDYANITGSPNYGSSSTVFTEFTVSKTFDIYVGMIIDADQVEGVQLSHNITITGTSSGLLYTFALDNTDSAVTMNMSHNITNQLNYTYSGTNRDLHKITVTVTTTGSLATDYVFGDTIPCNFTVTENNDADGDLPGENDLPPYTTTVTSYLKLPEVILVGVNVPSERIATPMLSDLVTESEGILSYGLDKGNSANVTIYSLGKISNSSGNNSDIDILIVTLNLTPTDPNYANCLTYSLTVGEEDLGNDIRIATGNFSKSFNFNYLQDYKIAGIGAALEMSVYSAVLVKYIGGITPITLREGYSQFDPISFATTRSLQHTLNLEISVGYDSKSIRYITSTNEDQRPEEYSTLNIQDSANTDIYFTGDDHNSGNTIHLTSRDLMIGIKSSLSSIPYKIDGDPESTSSVRLHYVVRKSNDLNTLDDGNIIGFGQTEIVDEINMYVKEGNEYVLANLDPEDPSYVVLNSYNSMRGLNTYMRLKNGMNSRYLKISVYATMPTNFPEKYDYGGLPNIDNAIGIVVFDFGESPTDITLSRSINIGNWKIHTDGDGNLRFTYLNNENGNGTQYYTMLAPFGVSRAVVHESISDGLNHRPNEL